MQNDLFILTLFPNYLFMTTETQQAQKEIVLGIIPGFVIALVKTDQEIIEKIAGKIGMDTDLVKFRMRYNCWTVDQFARLCNRSKSTITNLTLQPQLEEGNIVVALDHCYPYPSHTTGPKFIVRNKKSMNYLRSCI